MKKEELQALGSNVEPNTITFQNNEESTPIIELKSNGDNYVKGNLIENDKELVDAMREFLTNTHG
jgi:hypothetical protein